MATDIQKRRVVVYPLVTGPDYLGNADDVNVSFDAVPLTREFLAANGSSCLRNGETIKIRLALKYLDSNGAIQAVDLSGASSTVMHIWHRTTAAAIASRTEDAVIADSGGLVELEIDGDGTAGTITLAFHQDESFDSGFHHWAILSDWTYSEPLAAGTIDIRPAIPSA